MAAVSLRGAEAPASTSLSRPTSEFWGPQKLNLATPCRPVALRRGPQPVRMALNREGKEVTLERLTEEFKQATLVAGIDYTGLSVAQLQSFRRKLPEGSCLIIAKNTLVRKAAEANDVSSMAPILKGQNAWVFVRNEDVLANSVKTVRAIQKELKLDDFRGGVMEGKLLTADDIKSLEKLPTKLELIAKIAGAIKMVPTKVALSVKAVPRKVAYAAKALADKKAEEEGGSSSS